MDCVLADFVGGAAKAHGLSLEAVLAHWPAGEYAMPGAISQANGWTGADEQSDSWFWTPINNQDTFWHGLGLLPWAKTLLRAVRNFTNEWYLVTSPSRCYHCVPGKQEWVRSHLGEDPLERMILTKHKHL